MAGNAVFHFSSLSSKKELQDAIKQELKVDLPDDEDVPLPPADDDDNSGGENESRDADGGGAGEAASTGVATPAPEAAAAAAATAAAAAAESAEAAHISLQEGRVRGMSKNVGLSPHLPSPDDNPSLPGPVRNLSIIEARQRSGEWQPEGDVVAEEGSAVAEAATAGAAAAAPAASAEGSGAARESATTAAEAGSEEHGEGDKKEDEANSAVPAPVPVPEPVAAATATTTATAVASAETPAGESPAADPPSPSPTAPPTAALAAATTTTPVAAAAPAAVAVAASSAPAREGEGETGEEEKLKAQAVGTVAEPAPAPAPTTGQATSSSSEPAPEATRSADAATAATEGAAAAAPAASGDGDGNGEGKDTSAPMMSVVVTENSILHERPPNLRKATTPLFAPPVQAEARIAPPVPESDGEEEDEEEGKEKEEEGEEEHKGGEAKEDGEESPPGSPPPPPEEDQPTADLVYSSSTETFLTPAPPPEGPPPATPDISPLPGRRSLVFAETEQPAVTASTATATAATSSPTTTATATSSPPPAAATTAPTTTTAPITAATQTETKEDGKEGREGEEQSPSPPAEDPAAPAEAGGEDSDGRPTPPLRLGADVAPGVTAMPAVSLDGPTGSAPAVTDVPAPAPAAAGDDEEKKKKAGESSVSPAASSQDDGESGPDEEGGARKQAGEKDATGDVDEAAAAAAEPVPGAATASEAKVKKVEGSRSASANAASNGDEEVSEGDPPPPPPTDEEDEEGQESDWDPPVPDEAPPAAPGGGDDEPGRKEPGRPSVFKSVEVAADSPQATATLTEVELDAMSARVDKKSRRTVSYGAFPASLIGQKPDDDAKDAGVDAGGRALPSSASASAAMKPRTPKERTASVVQNLEYDMFSSSDEDDFKQLSLGASAVAHQRKKTTQELEKKMLTLKEQSRTFLVQKPNKYGLKRVKRQLCADMTQGALRFLDMSGKPRSEIPMTDVDVITPHPKREKQSTISFVKKGQRAYTIIFASAQDKNDFADVVQNWKQSNKDGAHKKSLVHDVTSDFSQFDSSKVLASDGQVYLDYHVKKKNKFGVSQKRILVLNPALKNMQLFDAKRKFIKSFSLANVMQFDSDNKNGAKSGAQLYIVFKPNVKQRTFQLFFQDEFDRLHFIERSVALAPDLQVKDDSNMDDVDCLRFSVLKPNRANRKKKRIIALVASQRVLRSFNRSKTPKDVRFDSILKIEKHTENSHRLHMYFKSRRARPVILLFADAYQREKFVSQFVFMSQTEAERTNPDKVFGRPLSLFLGSWNLGNCKPGASPIEQWVPARRHDIYAIGMQECSTSVRDSWIQEILRILDPTHKGKEDTHPYLLIAQVKLWEMLLIVFVRREIANKVTNVETDNVACGVGDVLGNKGGVAVSMCVEETRLAFIVSHLAARTERVVQRMENYQKIVKQLHLGMANVDVINQFDHLFWFGDLNYRLQDSFNNVIKMVQNQQWEEMLAIDQLQQEMASKNVFVGFKEERIRFIPTYRWEKDKNHFSNKRDQPPSYTDRILLRSLCDAKDIVQQTYTSAPDVFGSDHRPVSASYWLRPRRFYMGLAPKQMELAKKRALLGGAVATSKKVKEVRVTGTLYPRGTDMKNMENRDLSLIFASSFLSHAKSSRPVAFDTKHLHWSWTGVSLHPFVDDPVFVCSRHLIVTLSTAQDGADATSASADDKNKAGTRVAYASINVGEKSHPFKASFTFAGKVVGELTGQLDVVYHEKP